MTQEHALQPGFDGPWWRYPPLRNALAAGLIAGAGFLLAHLGFVTGTIENVFYWFAIPLGGWHWTREGIEKLVEEKEIGIEILMIAATVGSAILGLWDEAAALVFLYGAAEGTEEYTYARTRHAIRALLDLAPKEARVLRNGGEITVPAEALKPGEVFVVRPGEALPTDGIIKSGTSSLDESPVTGDQALAGMDGKVDLLINSGKCDDGVDSTVVDLTAQPFKILRSGSKGPEIQKALDELNNGVPPKFRVLYVCTGNTCRSPMAEWWLKTRLAKDGFEEKVEVESCGIFAYKNMPATNESSQVLKEDGIDLSKHLARPITHDMAREADFIYAMTAEHQQFILRQFPYLSGKITVLDVQDPIGMDLSVYRACYADIKKKMAEEVKTLEEKCK